MECPTEFCVNLQSNLLYTHHFVPAQVILYVIRLVTRIEAAIDFLVRHNRFLSKLDNTRAHLINGTGTEALLRDLRTDASTEKYLTRKRLHLRGLINVQVYPMLARWCTQATKENQVKRACRSHAHTAYLFAHIPPEELTAEIVTSLIAANVYLSTNYNYDLAAEHGAKYNRMDKERRGLDSGLGIADTEVFDVFQ
ncbi:hypothetical protein SARC_14510, partial [Sphaeroforma arctica JP610]